MQTLRFLFSILFSLALVNQAMAADHGWEFTAFGGGHFTSNLSIESGTGSDKLDLSNGSSFGLAVSKDLTTDSTIEVMWTRQNSRLKTEGGSAPAQDLGYLKMDQYRFNGLYFPEQPEGRTRLFVLAGLGATVFNPEGTTGSTTNFSYSLGGGVKVKLAEKAGLRFQALWSPVPYYTDSTTVCSSSTSGGNCYVARSGQMLQQIELTGGVYVRI